MDQIKIGKFISSCRKQKNMTQAELAERLNVSDRAVSKWETGRSMPDSSIMLELCELLGINVNELLSGERIMSEFSVKKTEELLLELTKQDELKNKKLMASMWTILITSSIFYFGILILATNTLEEGPLLGTIIVVSTLVLVVACFIALKFEVDAGYYECKKCHHRFVPSYKDALFAMHVGTTRYMKCPECGKWSWQKKVLTKDATDNDNTD